MNQFVARRIVQQLRLVQYRRFSTPSVIKPSESLPPSTVVENATEQAVEPKITTTTNLWRTRFASFSVGMMVMGVMGYTRLCEQINQANTDLKTRLAAAHADVSTTSTRIKALEGRLNVLEEKQALLKSTIIIEDDDAPVVAVKASGVDAV